MHKLMKLVVDSQLKKDIPKFRAGDTVEVMVKIIEEGKARSQSFEGVVIARAGSGPGETFTVRKVSYGEGIERVFPINSPSIESIKVGKKGDVRRAKLYYLKRKVGKASRVEEKIERGTAAPGKVAPAAAALPRAAA